MKRIFASFALALLVSAGAQAAAISTTLTVTGTGALSGTSIAATGTATLTGGIGNGTFAGTLSLTSTSGSNYVAPFTITLTPSGDKITGNLLIPQSLVTAALSGSGSGSGTISATVTGGTGTYAGATGSFAALTGSLGGSLLSGLTLNFTGPGTITTTGGGGGPVVPVPTITEVLDAASNNPNVAQGSIFIVKGSNLSASGYTPFDVPRPTTSAGVKITFTPAAGGTGTDAFLLYLYNVSGVNQLSGILPSTVAPGNYNVTVTNGSVSAPVPTQVLQRKFTLFTQDNTGTGLASVQNYISASVVDLNSFTTGSGKSTTISPAKPGQFLLAYGTGMGPFASGDNTVTPPPVFDFTPTVTVRAIVGGVSIPAAFAGRAGYPGQDQVNFQLPADVPTGCSVSFQVSVNGVLSNPTTIAIAPNAGASACVQPGYTTEQLRNFDQGGSYTSGVFYLTQYTLTVPQVGIVKANAAGGGFYKLTGFQLGSSAATQSQISTSGDCQVTRVVITGGQGSGGGSVTGLDAGTVTLNGPAASNISNLAFKQDSKYNAYSLTLATEGIPIPGGSNGTITAGTYTVAGAGGKDVGRFNASLTMGSPISITGGLPATVNRASGLTLNWTGGNSSDLVQIVGSSSVITGTGTNATTDSTSFTCTTTAGRGTFTVPASILLQLPAVGAAGASGAGSLTVASSINPTSGNGLFTAPLTAGGNIDSGIFLGFVGTTNTPAYQ